MPAQPPAAAGVPVCASAETLRAAGFATCGIGSFKVALMGKVILSHLI